MNEDIVTVQDAIMGPFMATSVSKLFSSRFGGCIKEPRWGFSTLSPLPPAHFSGDVAGEGRGENVLLLLILLLASGADPQQHGSTDTRCSSIPWCSSTPWCSSIPRPTPYPPLPHRGSQQPRSLLQWVAAPLGSRCPQPSSSVHPAVRLSSFCLFSARDRAPSRRRFRWPGDEERVTNPAPCLPLQSWALAPLRFSSPPAGKNRVFIHPICPPSLAVLEAFVPCKRSGPCVPLAAELVAHGNWRTEQR